MADDLSNYKLQLQQVQVALLSDPENAELIKLKSDIGKPKTNINKIMENVLFLLFSETNIDICNQTLCIDSDQLITLQQELIKTTEVEQRKYIEPSSSSGGADRSYYKDQKAKSLKIWKVGEKCMARDTTNGQ